MAITEATSEPQLNDVRPMTGDEYIESLRDDREIYIYGERVDDVTTHPAFRNSVRSVARLYDALHDPDLKPVLTTETDTGNGGFTHRWFKIATTGDENDVVKQRDAIVAWQRLVYGWMGRTPDYKAAFLRTLNANKDYYGEYADNAVTYYKSTQERVTYVNHALVHPPIDRNLPPDQATDVCVHVEKETDNGLIVSGAKVVATGSAITNDCFIGHFAEVPIRKKEFGLVFTLPMSTKGLKLISRASYEQGAATLGSPFDYPLSSRFDENDAIVVLDKALVPWENVFMYDADAANTWAVDCGMLPGFAFHGCTRAAVKLDFIAGCLIKAVKMTGTAAFRGVQVAVGEVLVWRDLFWAFSDAMAKSPELWVHNTLQPNFSYALSYRAILTIAYPRVREIIMQTLGSGLIYLNSSAEDFKNPDIRPYIDRYIRGSNDVEAVDRVKLLKLLWDAVGTQFAGRHELYERNYSGNHEFVRMNSLQFHQAAGSAAAMEGFAEQAMAEYDLDGWTSPDLFNPDDVSFLNRQH